MLDFGAIIREFGPGVGFTLIVLGIFAAIAIPYGRAQSERVKAGARTTDAAANDIKQGTDTQRLVGEMAIENMRLFTQQNERYNNLFSQFAELKAANSRTEGAYETFQKLSGEIIAGKDHLIAATEGAFRTVIETKQWLEGRVAELEDTKKAQTDEMKRLAQQNTDQAEEIMQLGYKMKDLQSTVNLNEDVKNRKETENGQLREINSTLEGENQTLLQKVEDLTALVKAQGEQITVLQTENTELKARIEHLESERPASAPVAVEASTGG